MITDNKSINFDQPRIDETTDQYDVVIMGAGFAGICQARHLLLRMPQLRVALIDPRPIERRDKDMKIGESMVEIAALFVCKELGLHDYMIENHTPKQGLNFHWPKQHDRTAKLNDDYYHVWINRQVAIPSFHMNRAKFERDVLKLTLPMGVDYIQGHVVDADLTKGSARHSVSVKTVDGEHLELKGKHVVDAAGRRFIVGKKKDNLLFGPDNLCGVNNGSAWVRVRNVDRTLLHKGLDPQGSTTSKYYCTNHWFGHGHWLWMIPTCSKTMELSVGVMHHHNIIAADQLDRKEKFYSFLKANHRALFDIVDSGEDVDFYYWSRVAHRSKEMFSKDNWYVIGDAAYIIDAFYSYGSSTIAMAIESVTEIVRSEISGAADTEEKRDAYNQFNVKYAESVNAIIAHHDKHLGHASVMSWRIYFEYMWWFGLHVPLYFGKWHLDVPFTKTFLKALQGNLDGLFPNVYDTFTKVVEKGGNIGLLDACRADQLLGHYGTLHHFDNFLENAKVEPRKCNVFVGLKYTCLYMALWYAKLQWKARGFRGIADPKSWFHFVRLLGMACHAGIGDLYYRFVTRNVPPNTQIEQMRQHAKYYQFKPTLRPWTRKPQNSAGPILNMSESQEESPASSKSISQPDVVASVMS